MSNSGITAADSAEANLLHALRERAAVSIRQREASLAALDACQRRLVGVERQNVELTEVVAELQAQLARAGHGQQAPPDEQGALEALHAQVRQVESWREQAERHIARLRAENQGLVDQVKHLEEQGERFRSRNTELLRGDKALRRELDAARQSQEALRSELEAKAKELGQQAADLVQREKVAVRKADLLASELSDVRVALSEKQREIAELIRTREATQEALRAEEAAKLTLENELRTARSLSEGNQERVQNLQGDIARLQADLEASTEEVRTLETREAEGEARIEALQRMLAEHQEALGEREQMLAAQRDRVAKLEAEYAGAQQRVGDLEQTLRQRSEQLEELAASGAITQQQSDEADRAERAVRLRSARIFHLVGEVFGAALKRAVGGLAWLSLTDAWEQRLGLLPEPPALSHQDVEALAQRLRHWFVDTGFSCKIVVACELDTVSVHVAGSETGDDGATVVAQAALMVPLLLRSRSLVLRDIGESEHGRRLVFQPDPKRVGQPDRAGGSD